VKIQFRGALLRFAAAAVVASPAAALADDVQCYVTDTVFPSFDMACQVDTDCVVGVHQVNCCGTRHALGINANELARFSDDEAICESEYAACGCADFGIQADDGQRTYEAADIGVVCADGACTTFVMPE
jgi:hypothetical protein